MKAIKLVGLGLIISTFAQAQEGANSKRMVGAEPPIGVRASRDVGEVVYSKFDYTATAGIRVLEDFSTRELLRRVTLLQGTFLTATESKKATDYCTKEGAVSGFEPGEIVCFRDLDRDGRLERLHIPGTRFGAYKVVEGSGPRYKEDVDLDATIGFRRELLYDGLSSGVVRLGYREFINSMARPAFQQDLTYTLEPSGPTEVGFRGARLRIHSASNQGIDYEVISGLRD